MREIFPNFLHDQNLWRTLDRWIDRVSEIVEARTTKRQPRRIERKALPKSA